MYYNSSIRFAKRERQQTGAAKHQFLSPKWEKGSFCAANPAPQKLGLRIMESNRRTTAGNLKISEDVIASVAALAAKEVKGVASLAQGPLALRELLHGPGQGKSITVALDNDSAVLDVYVVLRSGARIQETAAQIQSSVKESVQNMTGLTVKRVNVHVADIDFTAPVKSE